MYGVRKRTDGMVQIKRNRAPRPGLMISKDEFFFLLTKLRWKYKWHAFACLSGWHHWFDALQWLGKDDQYCLYCDKRRIGDYNE